MTDWLMLLGAGYTAITLFYGRTDCCTGETTEIVCLFVCFMTLISVKFKDFASRKVMLPNRL